MIVDFPDPSNFGLGKLYSTPIYRLMETAFTAAWSDGGAIDLADVCATGVLVSGGDPTKSRLADHAVSCAGALVW